MNCATAREAANSFDTKMVKKDKRALIHKSGSDELSEAKSSAHDHDADDYHDDESVGDETVAPKKGSLKKTKQGKTSMGAKRKQREEEEAEDSLPEDEEEAKSKKPKPKDAAKFTDSSQGEAKPVQTTSGGSILSDQLFDSLDVCEETKSGVADLGFKLMTLIQSKTIVPLLSGKDLLAQARTGSGKTLAFLIPCIELLHKSHFAQRNGTGVIVLSPTRELSLQTYAVAREVQYTPIQKLNSVSNP
jgi:ATP-dependent RNA helicase DDX18/HAS1